MNELEFRKWMNEKGIKKKMQSDFISRIKKIEHEIENCDIDEQYRRDKCRYLFSLFNNKGINENMKKYGDIKLPIGKYQLSVYKYSIKKYVEFLEG